MKKSFILLTVLLILTTNDFLFAQTANKNNERYQKGWNKLKQIDGHAGEKVIESLADISPDLGNYIIEYVFGDVYGRDAISDKEREVAVISSLTALGNAAPQLKVHLHAALNTGCSPAEIIQIINQTAPYAGIPASLNALYTFRLVLAERKIDFKATQKPETYTRIIEQGKTKLNNLRDNQHQILKQYLADVAPEMTEYITYTYGYLLNEIKLDPKLRLIATIASLTAMGNAASSLKFYIEAAIHIGIKPEKIREIMITMSVYAGFPAALNSIFILKEVLKEAKLTIEN